MEKKTFIYTDASGLAHNTGEHHPENIRRLETLQALFANAPFRDLPRGTVKPASEQQILRAHTFAYLQSLYDSAPDTGHAQIDNDTVMSPGSLDAAFHAAGAACSAVDDVMTGRAIRAFCAMRPPGHHAEPDRAMGFCLFNTVFIAARHAQETHGVRKIAIVDFDVHHGNGTDRMARAHDGSIFFVSTHQHPLWPMTGLEEDNDESVMNFILPPASGSETFRSVYKNKIFPMLDSFAPDLLMISAGFDAHRDDPLAQIELETEDFSWITKELCRLAETHCGGKVISVLEGGYDLEALKDSVAAHLRVLADID